MKKKIEKEADLYARKSMTKKAFKEKQKAERGDLLPRGTVFSRGTDYKRSSSKQELRKILSEC